MAIQRILDEMQEYKCIQFIQFNNYLQVRNFNCKKLLVYSYCYPIFLYTCTIVCKMLTFSSIVQLMYFELSGDKKVLLELTEVFEL